MDPHQTRRVPILRQHVIEHVRHRRGLRLQQAHLTAGRISLSGQVCSQVDIALQSTERSVMTTNPSGMQVQAPMPTDQTNRAESEELDYELVEPLVVVPVANPVSPVEPSAAPTHTSIREPMITPGDTCCTLIGLAEAGDVTAQLDLGMRYHEGCGVAQDGRQAVYWWRKAAEHGHAVGQYSLGTCYSEGIGVPQDDAQAVYWWRKAAEQGSAGGYCGLGCAYLQGRGVDQDDNEALRWYRMAADQGNADGQFALGCMYDTGHAVQQDHEQALNWWRCAARQGFADAKQAIEDYESKGHLPKQDSGGGGCLGVVLMGLGGLISVAVPPLGILVAVIGIILIIGRFLNRA